MKTIYSYSLKSLTKSNLKQDYQFDLDGSLVTILKNFDKLTLTISGNLDDTEEKAFQLSNYLEYIFTFTFGEFHIAFINYKEVGDEGDEDIEKRNCVAFGTDIRFIVPIDETRLDSVDCTKYWTVKDSVAWYIEGKRLNISILKFPCFFKVLENVYDPGRGPGKPNSRLERLKASALANLVSSLTMTKPLLFFGLNVPGIIEKFVELRDLCSHFETNYGYSPLNKSDNNEIRKWLPAIERLSLEAIKANSI